MTETTHTIVGATIALAFKDQPAVGLSAAFLSHFALDAIPHWHYRLKSRVKDTDTYLGFKINFGRDFLQDLLPIILDGILSFALLFVLLPDLPTNYVLLGFAGAVSGALPDFLQLIFYAFPNSPLKYHQQFHEWIHAKKRLDSQPFLGIVSQLLITLFTLWLAFRLPIF